LALIIDYGYVICSIFFCTTFDMVVCYCDGVDVKSYLYEDNV